MKSWLAYLVVSGLTGSPLLGLAVVLLVWAAGGSWWVGRLPDLGGPWRRWQQQRRLRDTLATNPHDLVARTDLAGLICSAAPAEAVELLGEVLRRYPDNELAHYWLGRAHLAAGRLPEGKAAIERALTLRRELRWGEPGVVLGDALLAAGQPREALAAYRRSTDVHGSHAEAWFKAGRAAHAAGDTAEARRLWERTLSSTAGAPPYKARQDRLWRWRAWWALRQA